MLGIRVKGKESKLSCLNLWKALMEAASMRFQYETCNRQPILLASSNWIPLLIAYSGARIWAQ